MSISNLLSSNNFDIKCKSLTAESITAGNLPGGIDIDVSFQKTAVTDNIPISLETSEPANWLTADANLTNSGNTFNWPLDTTKTQILDLSMSLLNSNTNGTRAAGIALMFQKSDDSWDGLNVPYVWNVINSIETVQMRLVHKLSVGHGYKRARLMVNAIGNGLDVRYGFGALTTGCFCSLTTTSIS